jgi:hypothetical protein
MKWWALPKDSALDVVYVYLIIIPLFLIASLWEFLAQVSSHEYVWILLQNLECDIV